MEKTSCCDISPPFSEKQLPIAKRWLEENTESINTFTEAIQKPVLYAPPIRAATMLESLLILENTVKEMTRSVQKRCKYRLSTGDSAGAWDDVRLLYRLADLHRPSIFNVVALLVHNAVQSVVDNRGYLIYSVGTSGIDEGGRTNNDTPRGDDIRRR